MIIIKTSNGDAFVNEAEMQQVEHLRDKRQVKITTRVGLRTINDVEAVLYATDVSHWQDEGSQVAHLHSLVTKLERQNWHYKGLAEVREDAMREFDRKLDIINEELKTGNIDEVKSIVKNYVDRRPGIIENIKNYENALEESKVECARIAQEQIEQDNELECQRQQEREEQENLINVLRHQVMDADLMLGRMKNRSLWQRIRNKV